MNCARCDSYNRGLGTRACLICEKYKDIQKRSVRRKTIRWEVVPQVLLDAFPDEQQGSDVLDAVRNLPADLAIIVALRFYLDFRMGEIADKLKISRKTASERLKTALRVLRG